MAAVVRLPLTGGCVCGAVRYRLSGAPLLVYACHCHDCQKRSGSAFTLTTVIRTHELEVSGTLDVTRTTTRLGREIDQSLCPACQTRIVSRAVVAPEYASLRVGTLDDASWARPIAQMFVESAIPWAVIPGVRQIGLDEFEPYALGEAWRATAPAFDPAEASAR